MITIVALTKRLLPGRSLRNLEGFPAIFSIASNYLYPLDARSTVRLYPAITLSEDHVQEIVYELQYDLMECKAS